MQNSSPPAGPAFQTKGLCYAYAEQIIALEHIDISVQTGERVAILGSNGSGKSTLLKLLDGLFFPTAGSIAAFGEELTETALQNEGFHYRFRSRVGLLFQDSDAQLFMPSVWEEVAFAPLQMGLDKKEVLARVDAALDSLQIHPLRDRAPHQLSGGEKKRVALASILSLAPEAWLLDEPSAGLDPRSVAWMVDYLNGQAAAGKTVVMATHDIGILESTADRVYVLDEKHRVLEEGSPREILSRRSLLAQANLIRAE